MRSAIHEQLKLGPRYDYVRDLGRGGVGRVMLVRDRLLGTEVAYKLLLQPAVGRRELDAFRREFALLAELEHPGIARAHDFGFLDERPFFTSEFIPGESLRAVARPGEPDATLASVRELIEAVAFLHRGGLLHLDIKPSNVIVSDAASRRRAVLIDFGLFRDGARDAAPRAIKGSLPFMAPECFRGDVLGPWTDVYALGVTMYSLWTGRYPRRSSARSLEAMPVPPSRHCEALRGDLEDIVLKCLALEPSSRFSSADELLRALESLPGATAGAGGPGVARSPTIGRAEELRAVEGVLERVGEAGEAAVMGITAPRGAGVTHFLRDVKVRAQTRGLSLHLETGYAGHAGAPGGLLRGLALAIDDDDARTRWEQFLSRLRQPRRERRRETSEGERRMRRAGELRRAALAVSRSFVLAVDGLEYGDEISVEFVVELVRILTRAAPEERPPIGVVVAYREEGAALPDLRELTAEFLDDPAAELLTLRPLGAEETIELARASGEDDADGLEVYQRSDGLPARVVAGGRSESARGDDGELDALPADTRRLLAVLVFLCRPAAVSELARIAGVPEGRADEYTRQMEALGLIDIVESNAAASLRLATASGARVMDGFTPSSRAALHAKIAAALARRARSSPAALHEAVRHYRLAGKKRPVAELGLRAARWLRDTFQNRKALECYGAVIDALPARSAARRLEVVFELAGVLVRIGELDEGIRRLQSALRESTSLAPGPRARALLWLATLHSRRGDFRGAAALFDEGFALHASAGSGKGLAGEELLNFLNEHASMKGFVGDYDAALAICEDGLRRARRGRSIAHRELALNLHATRANALLRRFEHDAAIEELERALDIAATIGSAVNQAVILNNLGIVYGNRDRHGDAIRALREAEEVSARLDEGPSLISIHGNLAVLHAKTGDFDAAESALAEAERIRPAELGRRMELFLQHCRGLARLNAGRYAAARSAFDAAIALAAETGDRLMECFDRVYRAEALIFEARCEDAARELEALQGEDVPARIRAMAAARAALGAAWLGDVEGARAAARRRDAMVLEDDVPFLDAWDDLLIAWALSIAGVGSGDRGEGGEDGETEIDERLQRAEAHFASKGLRPAAALARWIAAERCFLGGRLDEARRLLADEGVASSEIGLAGALRALLLARLAIDESVDVPLERCADMLSEAGGRFVGNELPEWRGRLDALRAVFAPDTRAAGAERPAREHWRRWTTGLRCVDGGASRRAEDATPETRTATMASARREIVAESAAMRRLLEELERLRESELPTLIRGETGSGKETIARILHEESRRARERFVVLDCATIPDALFEVELFGARAGAFTDLPADREGVLAAASGGTILIDEIALAPLDIQAKLLRVLSSGRFRPIGAEDERESDIRFLFSTSRELEEETRAGRFREDLLHRIRVATIDVPPLRQRPEDLAGLVSAFLEDEDVGAGAPELQDGALERLREHPWPGNVRELRNVIARLRLDGAQRIDAEAVSRILEGPRTASFFPKNVLADASLTELKDRLERDYLVYHLQRLDCDTRALATFLGLNRQQLYRRCRKLGVRLWEERQRRR